MAGLPVIIMCLPADKTWAAINKGKESNEWRWKVTTPSFNVYRIMFLGLKFYNMSIYLKKKKDKNVTISCSKINCPVLTFNRLSPCTVWPSGWISSHVPSREDWRFECFLLVDNFSLCGLYLFIHLFCCCCLGCSLPASPQRVNAYVRFLGKSRKLFGMSRYMKRFELNSAV